MVLTLDLQDFLLRGRVLKLYRQALRIARRAPNGSSDELRQIIRQEIENNRTCNDRQRIRFLISDGLERLKRLDETLDMQELVMPSLHSRNFHEFTMASSHPLSWNTWDFSKTDGQPSGPNLSKSHFQLAQSPLLGSQPFYVLFSTSQFPLVGRFPSPDFLQGVIVGDGVGIDGRKSCECLRLVTRSSILPNKISMLSKKVAKNNHYDLGLSPNHRPIVSGRVGSGHQVELGFRLAQPTNSGRVSAGCGRVIEDD
ncbi:unnamed protein product [Fraxinus pennsylvanica]|uniref:LYR motif-containing protein 2 n=1 Tax=Fraxinus pennsylvanica TaxID=56036 RepID=A0AAD1ZYH8_9LAMI|nr:unnamed protein product [Fraxinus pennsylvanica]